MELATRHWWGLVLIKCQIHVINSDYIRKTTMAGVRTLGHHRTWSIALAVFELENEHNQWVDVKVNLDVQTWSISLALRVLAVRAFSLPWWSRRAQDRDRTAWTHKHVSTRRFWSMIMVMAWKWAHYNRCWKCRGHLWEVIRVHAPNIQAPGTNQLSFSPDISGDSTFNYSRSFYSRCHWHMACFPLPKHQKHHAVFLPEN